MKHRAWIILGVGCVLLWASMEVVAQRGGGRGGGGGGRGGGGGARGGGGGGRVGGGGGARPSGGGGMNRTPSFSGGGGVSRPATRPSVGGGGGGLGNRPSVGGGVANRPNVGGGAGARPGTRPPVGGGVTQLPANRPNLGGGATQLPANRPGAGGGVAQRPSVGQRPGVGGGPGISTLPSTRPDLGGRGGIGSRPGISQLPAGIAGGAIGAGLADRIGDRPATLPGLGDGRPGISQLPADRPLQDRRDGLHDRLTGDRLPGEGRPDQLPARDWNQVRQDWQNQRDDIRQDWQNHRDEAREDWQNWFDDHYPWHGGWYWGHAPGYWGRWDYLWDNYPVAAAVGLTWWGANALAYQFGYGEYYNPYYVETPVYNYAEPVVTLPIEVVYQQEAGQPAGALQGSIDKFDQARASFYEGDYANALKLTDEALAKLPHDAVLHEFRSLVLFAMQRYAEAAATIHAVLAVGPGWDAKTLTSLYADMDTYTTQLRALEAARNNNLKAAELRFLAGYHYLTLGYPTEALAEFREAAKLQPKDQVTASLVATLSPRDAKPTDTKAGAPKQVPPDSVVGSWTAPGKRTDKYTMSLNKDGTFFWAFSRGSKKEEVKGVYTVEGNVLAMEPDTGGVLLAELTPTESDGLQFKMIGGPKDDPGLAFQRGQAKN